MSHVNGWYILVCEPASKQNKNVHQCCLVVRPRFTYVWSRLQAVNLNHIMPFAFDDKQNIICYMVIKLKYMCLIAYIMKANVNYDKFWRPAKLHLLFAAQNYFIAFLWKQPKLHIYDIWFNVNSCKVHMNRLMSRCFGNIHFVYFYLFNLDISCDIKQNQTQWRSKR